MKSLRRGVAWRRLVANYCGGLGYYGLHFAWILTGFVVMMRALQYVVPAGRDIPPATGAQAASGSGELGLTGAVLSVVLTIVMAAAVALLPYYIGALSRRVPRWLLDQTSWHVTRRTLLRTKLCLVALASVVALVALYLPGAPAASNIAFLVTLAACATAVVGFGLQNVLARAWHLPVDELF